LKLAELKMFEENKYSNIGMNELIVYTVHILSENNHIVTREELVLGAFKMFPKKFGLKGHEDWPDSAVIDKRWIDCRHLDYISGTNKSGLSVLPKGLALVKTTEKKLKISSNKSAKEFENRTRSGKIVSIMEKSDGYKKYLETKKIEEINEFELREILHCTMDSTPEILNRSYTELIQHLEVCKKSQMIKFLNSLKEKYGSLFFSGYNEKYSGGMLKKLNN
tara:strand:+ start:220 stop:882 length:663 start_codon:yes stop_codon:yes gene_type:complete